MKKIFAIAIAVMMMVSAMAVTVFATADDTNMLLEIGDVFGTLVQSEIVDVSKGGEFTLSCSVDSALLTSSDSSFIGVKTTAGNVEQKTKLPDGTVVTVTSIELDDAKVELDAEKSTNTVANGVLDGNNGVVLLFKMGGLNALTGDVPKSFKTVKVTFTVENTGAAPSAPAEDNTPATPEADNTPAEDNTPAPTTTPEAPKTGLALAVVPAVMALAAVAVAKKH